MLGATSGVSKPSRHADNHAQSYDDHAVHNHKNAQEHTNEIPARLHSITNRWGESGVGLQPVTQWEDHTSEATKIVERCEKLYQTFMQAEGQPLEDITNVHAS